MTASRLTAYVPGRLDEHQAAVYAAVAHGPRAVGPQDFPLQNPDGSLTGPFNALVGAGALGAAVQSVGAAIRYHGALGDAEREIAILLVGRSWSADFEFYAHERVARRIGVADDVIAALAAGERPTLTDGRQRAVFELTTELLDSGRLDDPTYRRAVEVLGERDVIELVILIGYYTMLAQLLNAFDVGLPEGAESPFRRNGQHEPPTAHRHEGAHHGRP